jgi:AAA family ATP:ADP antiporter
MSPKRTLLDRMLSLFADVRAGEGTTVVLMLLNIFLLLICYSVIKTVREPLILLGGGAEVRSYAAAGQAVLLMGFVPVYSWWASRVDRIKLIVGITLFFVACVELFSIAVAAHIPYVGVAFFIWVGIFNISLIAQFWSFANDIYKKDAGHRLFPIIVIGMTAGAPLGSFVAARLFRLGITPQLILQTSALLLCLSLGLYLIVNRREVDRTGHHADDMSAAGGFGLVMTNRYLRLIALLVVLLNVVNTTGEYLVARLLTVHASELAAATPAFDKQAYIGAFSGDYQFWVNVLALTIQALVTSRLVKHKGLGGALLALPLIALGGYTLIAAGVGFSMVRWIKTAENATDYSIMNTARQLLWLPTTREEKYKAKQAIDTFFVRGGDLLSAAVVYTGTHVLQLSIARFALVNVVMTLAWIGVALLILKPRVRVPRLALSPVTRAAVLLCVIALPASAFAQDSREAAMAEARARKADVLHPYEAQGLERSLEQIDALVLSPKTVYPFIGSTFEGGGLAVGPGYRVHFADSGTVNVFGAWSFRNYKTLDATVDFPAFADDRVTIQANGHWMDAPSVAFYGVGGKTTREMRSNFQYRTASAGVSGRVQVAPFVAAGGGLELLDLQTAFTSASPAASLDPTYRRSHAFAEVDWRTSPDYTRRGGLYRVDVSDYRQTNAGANSFRRVDAEVQQFVPILRENWIMAFRALASSTDAAPGETVPYFLMPSLGGNHALRGFSPWRFRDNNRLLLSGEYRWTAGAYVDMALFVDAGNVAPRLSDLSLRDLKISKGIGVSFHTPRATVVRMEVARAAEGTTLILSFSPSF